MTETVIRVENLSKQYRIGARERYKTFRETLLDAFKAPFRGLSRFSNPNSEIRIPKSETIWALKDVSFDVKRGEVVGIIGRNGAGKSTLLKILSKITEPTEGRVELKGRVGSLLEVGTGFHPELTGHENIYLYGAILGMDRWEVTRKFDEIVAFAELEKFVDTPVKRYSSGMYMRLAFAVAAHLEPEILLVDEVLAVGDAAFQKKCLGKMGDVSKEGRTVIFVSHNMAAIVSLCERAALLDNGKLVHQGPAPEITRYYLQSITSTELIPLEQRQDRSGDGSVKVVSVRIQSTDADKVIRSTSRLEVTLSYRSEKALNYPQFLVGIYDYTNTGIFLLNSDAVGGLPEVLPSEGSVTCVTEPIKLTAGRCFVNIAVLKGGVIADYIQYAARFDVEAEDVYGSGKVPGRDWVLCLLQHKWTLNEN